LFVASPTFTQVIAFRSIARSFEIKQG